MHFWTGVFTKSYSGEIYLQHISPPLSYTVLGVFPTNLTIHNTYPSSSLYSSPSSNIYTSYLHREAPLLGYKNFITREARRYPYEDNNHCLRTTQSNQMRLLQRLVPIRDMRLRSMLECVPHWRGLPQRPTSQGGWVQELRHSLRFLHSQGVGSSPSPTAPSLWLSELRLKGSKERKDIHHETLPTVWGTDHNAMGRRAVHPVQTHTKCNNSILHRGRTQTRHTNRLLPTNKLLQASSTELTPMTFDNWFRFGYQSYATKKIRKNSFLSIIRSFRAKGALWLSHKCWC